MNNGAASTFNLLKGDETMKANAKQLLTLALFVAVCAVLVGWSTSKHWSVVRENTLFLNDVAVDDGGSLEVATIDLNGGALDGVTIGAAVASTATLASADINGGTIDGVTIGASAAPTVTNLGTVTTADINGGTIDGTTIGATTPGAITASSLKVGTVGATMTAIAKGTVSMGNATSATVTIAGFDTDDLAVIVNLTDPETDDTEFHVQRYTGHFDVLCDAATTVTVGYLAILD